jgi:hypothetical protein
VGQHRSPEEIAAAKAEKAQAKADRLAERQAKCAAVYKLPCVGGCSRGCKRNKVAKNAAAARSARRERDRKARERGVQNRDAAGEAKRQAELAAVQFEMKARKSKLRELERWQASVMYLCGQTVDQINDAIGEGKRRGPINRVVTTGRLEAVRKSDARLRRLAELFHKTPGGMQGFVAHWAVRSPTAGLWRHLQAILSTKPESVRMTQKLRGGGERIWNPNASALHAEASAGGIDEYCLQAGVWLSGLFDRIGAGGVRGFDPTRDIVDGSAAGNGAESSVDALKIETMVKEHVIAAFRPDGTAEWRWRVLDHVVRLDHPLDKLDLPAALGLPVRFLNEALEEVAICRHMAPSGIRSRRPGGEFDVAYNNASRLESEAVREHYVLRAAEGRQFP